MEAQFLSAGTLFYQVAMEQPFRFMELQGSSSFYSREAADGCWTLRRLNADGRVMVDLLSFARMNPDYPLKNACPPCELMTGTWSSGPAATAGNDEVTKKQLQQPSAEELMLAPTFVYGFSFRLKRWGCFEVCGLREISFNEGACEAVKMKDERQKMMLCDVVQAFVNKEKGDIASIDAIANKGAGCVVLCHGPPGTGKTLAVEAIAESMRCPLWAISGLDLGEERSVLEIRLLQIMEIAYKWRAILLLDEADAYVQSKRDEVAAGDYPHAIQRNPLIIGVFLRLLEYHRGLMFLTTNHAITAFDDAILSRITWSVSFPTLQDSQRHHIWSTLLLRAGIDIDNGNDNDKNKC